MPLINGQFAVQISIYLYLKRSWISHSVSFLCEGRNCRDATRSVVWRQAKCNRQDMWRVDIACRRNHGTGCSRRV